jgi:DinB superfamily
MKLLSEAVMQTSAVAHIRPAISLLEKTPVLYETLLADLPSDLLQWKPGPDRWSISEVLAHVAEIEKVYSGRVRRMVAEDSPAFQRYEPPGPTDEATYTRGLAAEHLARFVTDRRAVVGLLKGLPAAAGARSGTHSELGVITVSQMLCEWASHDLGHLRQIAEIYRAHAFYPHAGPFQKYSNPKP